MKKLTVAMLAASLLFAAVRANSDDADVEKTTLTRVGDVAPVFDVATLGGQKFDLNQLRGKVVLVNFFATWCGSCMAEMPHLKKDVWNKFKDRNFAMISIGREHSQEELTEFRKKKGCAWPIAPDPKRGIYGKYAMEFIPRNYVIAPDGKIIFQSVGYTSEEFDRMVAVIQTELEKFAAK